MTELVRKFIETNIELIEEEMFNDVYDQAYEWLTHDQTKELTDVLSDTLGVDAERYAKENLMSHFMFELQNFVKDNKNGKSGVMFLPTFVRSYMNHLNGIDFDEFVLLVEQFVRPSTKVKFLDDGNGDAYLEIIK